MTTKTAWFEVDKEGLARLLERKGKEFILYELIQNAWDTDAKKVDVFLDASDLRGYASLSVLDDHPDGWKDLAHAWTLFAESEKKGNAEKRGRFNLGEKLVLSLCREARIETTTGGVRFDGEGRHAIRTRRESGSIFSALVKMTQDERLAMDAAVRKLIPPAHVSTSFNTIPIEPRTPLRVIEVTLPTEVADAEGILRKTARKTKVEIYAPHEGEVPSIYEMGIPVVETGDKWHYNIQQKVPLNADRDNVTPAYLREVRTLVLNEMYREVTKEDAVEKWVRDAAEDEQASKPAIEHVITQRFGERRVIADPSDPEGTMKAVSEGYAVIQPGSLSKGEWRNVKRDAVALPAGQVTPSAKPYSPDGSPLKLIPEEEWSDAIARVVRYTKALAWELLGHQVVVKVAREVTWPYGATYNGIELVFNMGRLGRAWFEAGPGQAVDRLLLHEFAHEGGVHHLEERYHEAICRLGAKLAQLALDRPEFLRQWGR